MKKDEEIRRKRKSRNGGGIGRRRGEREELSCYRKMRKFKDFFKGT